MLDSIIGGVEGSAPFNCLTPNDELYGSATVEALR